MPEDRLLMATPWLELRSIDNYDYVHEVRCHGHIVMVLPYRWKPNIRGRVREFLLRNEATPCWDNDVPQVSSITGGCENVQATEGMPDEERFLPDAVRELLEETGYDAPADRFTYLGRCFGPKSADTHYHLFAVDLTGIPEGEAKGDGSAHEAAATNEWHPDTVKAVCPLVAVSYVRGMHRGLFA